MPTSSILPREFPGDSKRCTRCGVIRPLNDFHKSRRQYDGRSSACKFCRTGNNTNTDSADFNRCIKCGEIKPISEFRTRHGNASSLCKICAGRQRSESAVDLLGRGLKLCPGCHQTKSLAAFSKDRSQSDGHCTRCKTCMTGAAAEEKCVLLASGLRRCIVCCEIKPLGGFPFKDRKRRDDLRSTICYPCRAEQAKKRREDNPDHVRELARLRRLRDGDRMRAEARSRYWNDLHRKIHTCMSTAVRRGMIDRKNGRSWERIVGFTVDDLISHLESMFRPGMDWSNYGRGGWHVDHIRPVSSFSFSSYDDPEFKECWALSNLQPLWETDNLRKSNKWTG